METPSSTRVTRSQALAAALANNIPSSNMEKGLSNSRTTRKGKQQSQQQDRSVLFDITNDSPIVGLASGSLETPSSAVAKSRSSFVKRTPGSGEALLRGQVKTLLQKVEEEAELSKLSLEKRHVFLHGLKSFANSPAGLLAPTPANTPQILGLSTDQSVANSGGFGSEVVLPIVEETFISEVVLEKEQEESVDLKSIITRSLLLDFSEKSDGCESSECPSVLTCEGREKSTPDNNSSASSVWSVQVNASSSQDKDDDLDELCDFIRRISMSDGKTLPRFEGKHTRFVYDSDDEIVESKNESESDEV